MHPAFALARHKLDELRAEFETGLIIKDEVVPTIQATRQDIAATARSTLQASVIEGVYTGVEGVLKELLAIMDGGVFGASDNWHAQLLAQAATASDLRPAIMTEDTYRLLNELRAFRHIERNVYRNALRPVDVSRNMERLRTVFPRLEAEIRQFMATQNPPG